MKTIAIVYFCLAILPAFIDSNSDIDEEVTLLEELINTAERSGTINGIFKPAKDGFLGDGSCGFLYQGELLKPVRRIVAMKFIPPRNQEYAEKEYSIYTYLEAINNPDVERYGIPTVYYYGAYRNYTMMAITLLDKEFHFVFDDFHFDMIDMLMTIQEFVRITKYIHGRGIFHNDIKLKNMMFRRSRGFLIDYNVSEKLYESNDTTITPAMLRRNANRMAKKDWQQFFFSMCFYVGIMFDFSKFGANPLRNFRMIMKQIKEIEYSGLRRVFAEFAEYAFGDDIEKHPSRAQKKSFYDHVNDIINEEIARFKAPKPYLVSWLKMEDLDQAVLDAANTPDISSIEDLFEKTDAKYPAVHFDYFDKLISASSTNDYKCSEAETSHSIQQKMIKLSI